MNAYIILTDSTSNAYRFRVQFPRRGYRPIRRKANKIQQTVTGKIDNQVGPVTMEWQYTLVVAGTTDPDGSDYGVLSELRTLFDLNNPNGSPSNVLTLTDHYENTHSVYIVGDMQEEPFSPNLSGSCAWFRVPIHLVETTAVA